jgi:hypothetical protein
MQMPPGIGIFKLFYNDIYQVALPPTHRFPMGKYRIVRERIQHHAQAAANIDREASLLPHTADLRTTQSSAYAANVEHTSAYAANIDLEASPLARSADLRTTHCPEYIRRFLCNMLTEADSLTIHITSYYFIYADLRTTHFPEYIRRCVCNMLTEAGRLLHTQYILLYYFFTAYATC